MECATKRSTAAGFEWTSPSPSELTPQHLESTWAGLPTVTEAPRAVAATAETDMEETGMVATVTVAAIATEAATAAPGATAAVATGGLAPDLTRHAEAGAIPTTTERAPSRAGPINDLCTISDQMRIVNLRERKSTTSKDFGQRFRWIIRCCPDQAFEESEEIVCVKECGLA